MINDLLAEWASAAGTCFVPRDGSEVTYGSIKRSDLAQLVTAVMRSERIEGPVRAWCETCNGSGTVHAEHQRGVVGSGGEHQCPDCDGKGYRMVMQPAAPPVVMVTGDRHIPGELDRLLVEAARKYDCLAEACDLVDYDPENGRVPEHFKPRSWLRQIATWLAVQCAPEGCTPTDARVLREGNFALAAEAFGFRTVLERIAAWELPETGMTWESGRTMSYEAAYGSRGVQAYFQGLAKRALEGTEPRPAPDKSEAGCWHAGVVDAARHLKAKAEDYAEAYGGNDPDTGAFEFKREEQQEYYQTLVELADEIQGLAKPPCTRPDGMPASSTERHLRRLLAARVSMPHAYYDDGEACGAEHGITIDFMRDPVADLDAKLRALGVARLEVSMKAEPAVITPVAQLPETIVLAPDVGPFEVAGLLRRALGNLSMEFRASKRRRTGIFWGDVRELFGLGSNCAAGLARWAGYDPDTGLRLAEAPKPATAPAPAPVTQVQLCPDQACASAGKCTRLFSCSSRAVARPFDPS